MSQTTCAVDGCESGVMARRKMCNAHYKRLWRYGDPLAGGPFRPRREAPRPAQDFPDGTRICNACSIRKPLADFSPDKSKSGRRTQCKPCRCARVKQWYADNYETQRARQMAYIAANPEVVRETDRQRYQRDRDKRIALAAAQAERRRLTMRGRRYNRDVTRDNLREQYGDGCFYCETLMRFVRSYQGRHYADQATVEHVVPVSRGGWHDWDNVVLACWTCNQAKGVKTLHEWEVARSARLIDPTPHPLAAGGVELC